jgi:DNA-binding transcriptional regulator YdaS (Cro superfamily)
MHALQVAGGVSGMTDYLCKNYGRITRQAVSLWVRCPAERVLQVERATNGVVSRHRLRPDIYPEQS